MKIALIQTQLFWENPLENRKQFEKKINSVLGNADLKSFAQNDYLGFSINSEMVTE